MIKRFIKKIEESSSEAMVAILDYIDKTLDRHEKRMDGHRDKMDKFDNRLKELENNFKPVKTTVESNSDEKKNRNKLAMNTVITAIILYILSRFGIG